MWLKSEACMILPWKDEDEGILGRYGRPLRDVAWTMWWGWRVPVRSLD